MLAICLPMDNSWTLSSSFDVNLNRRGRYWYVDDHTQRISNARAVSPTYLVADTLKIETHYASIPKFLKPTASPLVEYTPPHALNESDRICALPI
jgi:hypothetical protein